MPIQRVLVVAVLALASISIAASPAFAQRTQKKRFRAELSGLSEVSAISTPAAGRFVLRFDTEGQMAVYKLSYAGLSGDVRFAHIHFGNEGTNGGVSVFLCTNEAGPAGTPACPQEGEVTGTITADDVVGPAGQGIGPGELEEILAAIRAGAAYVNVHSVPFPSGEIRGQIR